MPVGNGAVKELLPTPEQRAYVYHQIRKFRSEKPIFTMYSKMMRNMLVDVLLEEEDIFISMPKGM